MTALVTTLAFAGALAAHPLLVAVIFALATAVLARRWLRDRALLAVLVALTVTACALSDVAAQLTLPPGSATATAIHPALLYPFVTVYPVLHALLSR